MVKRVKIGKNEYDLKASVLTLETYKRLYDKDLFKLVMQLNDEYKKDDVMLNIQPIMLDVLKIAHVMIKEQNSNFLSYDEWIKDLDGLLDDPKWIIDVLEVAMSTFRTGVFEK